MKATKGVCIVCSKEFDIPNNVYTKKYCSPSCVKKAWKINNRQKYLLSSKKYNKKYNLRHKAQSIIRVCLVCKDIFKTNVRNPYQKFCSTICRSKFNYLKLRKNGRYWEIKKKYRLNNIDKIKKHDEEYKAKIRFGVESKTLNKRVVIKRDGGKCQMCGCNFQIIHHIKYSGKVDDLICLCRSCHAKVHRIDNSNKFKSIK